MRNKQWKQKKNPSKTLFSGYNQFKEVSFRYIQTLEFITTKYLSTNNNNILLNCILGIGSRVQSHENLIENAMVFFWIEGHFLIFYLLETLCCKIFYNEMEIKLFRFMMISRKSRFKLMYRIFDFMKIVVYRLELCCILRYMQIKWVVLACQPRADIAILI